jgi:hypothetical protein
MHRLLVFLLFLSCSLTAAFAQESSVGTSTVTFGVGGGFGGLNPLGTTGGPVFNGTYEFRVAKYFALETGVHNTLGTTFQYISLYTPVIIKAGAGLTPVTVLRGQTITTRAPARNTSVPFGFRGILPMKHGKVELFLGGDGAYTWNTNQNYQDWGVEGRLGARFALDKQRHFWLGATGEFLQEFGYSSQHWTTWTADFGYRFGK